MNPSYQRLDDPQETRQALTKSIKRLVTAADKLILLCTNGPTFKQFFFSIKSTEKLAEGKVGKIAIELQFIDQHRVHLTANEKEMILAKTKQCREKLKETTQFRLVNADKLQESLKVSWQSAGETPQKK